MEKIGAARGGASSGRWLCQVPPPTDRVQMCIGTGFRIYNFPRSGGDFVPPDKAKRTSADVLLLGGGRWIRTTEVSDNRFTVCPLWPLGNSPIFSCCGKSRWSWWTDLNPRPADYKSAALPAELHQRISHDAHHYITSDSPCQYLFEKFPIFYFFSFRKIIPRISIFLYGKNFIKLLIIPMQCGILLCV